MNGSSGWRTMRSPKWRQISLVLCLMLMVAASSLTASSTLAATQAPAPLDIPKLDNVKVDGDLSDWGEQGFRVEAVNWTEGRSPLSDFDPQYRLAWTDAGLLACATIRDDKTISPANLSSFFGTYQGDSFVVALSAGKDKPQTVRVVTGLGDKPNFAKAKSDIELPKDIKKSSDTLQQAAVKMTPQGYTVEVLVPWKALGFAAAEGKEVSVALQSFDADPSGLPAPADIKRGIAIWEPSPTPGKGFRLAKTASPAMRAAGGVMANAFTVAVAAITATADMAGKRFEIRKGDKQIASGLLQARDGRAVAEQVLPKRPGGPDINKDLDLYVDGAWIARFTASEGAKEGQLSAQITVTTSTLAVPKANIRVGLAFREKGTPYPAASTHVVFKDPMGKAVVKTECPMTVAGTTVSLPYGIYTIEMTIADLAGWKYTGNATCIASRDVRATMEETTARADAMQANPRYTDYAGWLNFMATDIRQYLAETSNPNNQLNAEARTVSLANWIAKIEKNPRILGKQRGTLEWGYLSKVDGTGQPITVTIPKSYSPRKVYALDVYLHGASGSHFATGDPEIPGIKLNVLGRSPYGGYRALSEVDVLEAIDYVRAHWNIDPDRIHLTGGSMGGGGTFAIASRHPDMFASARPFCGFGVDVPIENMLNVPICSTHSQDDWMVPIAESRAPILLLQAMGGSAIQNETDGVGHNVNAWKEGAAFAHAWAQQHTRANHPRRVHYTATDELARKAYWTEVVEWGPEPTPAVIDARLDSGNDLYLSLENMNIARFDLAASPADLKSTMTVVVNGTIVESLVAPLPKELYLVRSEKGWKASSSAPAAPAARRHFPGGAVALFHGEPIMVVWGTKGGDDLTSRIRNAARSARRSYNPVWPDITPHHPIAPIFDQSRNTFFGQLPGKPDTEVTAEDMQKYNLLLIGTAEQNTVVAKLADRLPVRVEGGKVVTKDGMSWDFNNRALGLLYYNPEAPNRLIYWVGSDVPKFYRTKTPLMNRQGWGAASPDLLVMAAEQDSQIAARTFDSAWNWEPGYKASPRVPDQFCSVMGRATLLCDGLREETGADFAMLTDDWSSTASAVGSRQSDFAASTYGERIALMDMTGREILENQAEFTKMEPAEQAKRARGEDYNDTGRFFGPSGNASIDPDRTYLVATIPWSVWDYSKSLQKNPRNFRLTDHTVREALQRPLPAATGGTKLAQTK